MTGVQALGVVAAYLIGGIPFGLLAGLSRGVDVRKHGSGNIGATNVIRVVGLKLGLLVFVLDTLKGLAGVLIGRALGMEGWMLPTVGLIAVMGHSFSPYLAFKGGKGVSTALRVLIAN
ncbi:MAG: glycerol-3-phosphate acyltransferase [Armatimonadetes bacterium]|nr:glycerol-3-phosphate acyltransferase [Armatimonadota bacterium]